MPKLRPPKVRQEAGPDGKENAASSPAALDGNPLAEFRSVQQDEIGSTSVSTSSSLAPEASAPVVHPPPLVFHASSSGDQAKVVRKKRVYWDKDEATPGGKSSLSIVVDWFTNFTNFQRWKGAAANGISKETLCGEVIGIMRANGILHRKNQDIRTKIQELVDSHRKAEDWRKNTGEGIIERRGEEESKNEIQAYILSICPFYDLLHPLLKDNPSTRPLATNEDDGDDAEDSSSGISTPLRDGPSRSTTPSIASQNSKRKRQSSTVKESFDAFNADAIKIESKRVLLEEARDKREEARERREEKLMDLQAKKLEAEAQQIQCDTLFKKIKARQELLASG
ncbi:hypothetical protein HDU67_004555, partial [Dinochytrium kinnereticum]